MSINSKQKGKRGELEAVHYFKEKGYNAERSQQYKGNAESADIKVQELQKYHFEIKRTERLNVYEAIEQAVRDSDNQIPIVMHRKSRKPWLVIMQADEWLKVVQDAEKLRKQ